MYKIRHADVNDAGILGEIHAGSWKAAYKGIVPDDILDNISTEKRQKYFEKALSEGREENFLIFADDKAVGFMCLENAEMKIKMLYGEIWEYIYFLKIGTRE